MKKTLLTFGLLTVLTYAEINECDRLAGHPNDKSLNGIGVEFEQLDADKAIVVCTETLKKEPENVRNMYELGRAYAKKKDYGKAKEWYEKAANQGSAAGQSSLGAMYANGFGVKQDDVKAVEWFEKAAKQGHAQAQFNLGIMYDNGRGVKQDYEKAVELYQKAAEQGFAQAQYSLGLMYYNGQGVKQDYEKAVEWFEKAAKQGISGAQNNVGAMYHNGEGVKQDYSKAVEWYEKAAKQGLAGAQNNLGTMYENGFGVNQDYAKAEEWYEKAAEQGYGNAQYSLNRVNRLIKEEEKKSSIWYKLSNFFGPSDETIIDLAYKYNIGYAKKSDIEIIKSYEKDGKTVQILQIKDMLCEMPMLEVKGKWRATGIIKIKGERAE